MDVLSNEALAGRVDRLERENRRLKRGAVAVLACGLALGVGGWQAAEKPRLVRATRFVLVNEDGATVGEWLPTPGGAVLEMADPSGKPGLTMGYPRQWTPDRDLPNVYPLLRSPERRAQERAREIASMPKAHPEVIIRTERNEIISTMPPYDELMKAR